MIKKDSCLRLLGKRYRLFWHVKIQRLLACGERTALLPLKKDRRHHQPRQYDAAAQPGRGDAPGHAGAAVAACRGGHHHQQRLRPLHDAARRVNDHGNGREQGRDAVFQAVHGQEVGLPQQAQQGQQQNAQSAVEIAAVAGYGQHAHGGAGRRGLAARQPRAQLRPEGNQRKVLSKEIGGLMKQGKKDEAEATKAKVNEMAEELARLEQLEEEYAAEIKKRMQVIPQIIDPSVPIGKDDSENVEIERFGEPVVPDFEVPYHVDIMEKLNGIDIDAARRTSGNGFYYLKGDIARLHSACLSYARDFMIDRGFTYYIPPYMIRSSVVTG